LGTGRRHVRQVYVEELSKKALTVAKEHPLRGSGHSSPLDRIVRDGKIV